jgi:hypothetical protein
LIVSVGQSASKRKATTVWTSPTLLNAKAYLNGKPVLQGDPSRIYSSELILSVNVAIVKSPDGGKVMTQSDPQLLAAMQKLKFGQIGAVKSGVTISSTDIVVGVVVPVQLEQTVSTKDALVHALDLDEYIRKFKCNINGQAMTIEQVKTILSRSREKNREIREAWSNKSKLMRQRGATSEDIILQKKESYAEYVSISAYSIAVSVSVTHYVHKPSLKGTIVDNCNEEQYNAFNYKEGNVRKTATQRMPIVSIPILNLEDRNSLLKWIGQLATSERLKAVSPKAERLVIEGSPFNEIQVDFTAIRDHDNSVVLIK